LGNPQETCLKAGILRDYTPTSSLKVVAMELSPDWVVGFTDGEGCFFVGINRNPSTSVGYQVLPEFVIVQHKRDIQVLYALKRFFRCGVVRPNHDDRYAYRVRDLQGLRKVRDFFLKHPLKTKKRIDFLRFNRILTMMERGDHLKLDGLLEIVQIALRMNTGNRPQLEQVAAEIKQRLQAG
jgi:hypothetical protein